MDREGWSDISEAGADRNGDKRSSPHLPPLQDSPAVPVHFREQEDGHHCAGSVIEFHFTTIRC